MWMHIIVDIVSRINIILLEETSKKLKKPTLLAIVLIS